MPILQPIRFIDTGEICSYVSLEEDEVYKGDDYYGFRSDTFVADPIQTEYEKYVQRKEDGVKAFLSLMAELRLFSKANSLPREINRDIEDRLELVKSQVIEGQWISAREKLDDVVVAGYLSQELYDRIKNTLDAYIAANY